MPPAWDEAGDACGYASSVAFGFEPSTDQGSDCVFCILVIHPDGSPT